MTPQNTTELRARTAAALRSETSRAAQLTTFVGLDGFVDEIIDVVDKRQDVSHYERIPTIASLGARIAEAAGRSTNIELVNRRTKLGGNGPIMANALASFGLNTTYVGTLGYPNLHPVFTEFSHRAKVISIGEPGHTDALEFEDGKLMLGKMYPLAEVTWENLNARAGHDTLARHIQNTSLLAFVNWTMLPHMSTIWERMLTESLPAVTGKRRWMFFDLADPAKRTRQDLLHALELIHKFNTKFKVILGLNEKEAFEVGEALGYPLPDASPAGLAGLSQRIAEKVAVETLVVHPVSYALAVTGGQVSMVSGPRITKPLITTGAGDHFNAGFCLGKLFGLDDASSVLTGVTTSGYYVRTATTPGVLDLAGMMDNWPS
jgi:sugar/nucleoside kinase (ribokinase family)